MKQSAVVHQEQPRQPRLKKFFKAIGIAGFLFFLIKGLLWLAVFFGLLDFITT